MTDQRSASATEYRKLYHTARWRKLRDAHKWTSPLCVYCLEQEIVQEVQVVDHIKPHRGDMELFWDATNLQSLCSECHDGRKQREDLGQTIVSFGSDGWPVG